MPEPIAFHEFADEPLALYRATRAGKTGAKMRQVLDLVRAAASPATTADLTPALLPRFAALAAEGRHPKTAATLLSYLRAGCAYAARRGLVACNPFATWPGWVKYVESRGPGVHDPATIARVLAELAARGGESVPAGRLHAWASVLAFTGMRRDEGLFLAVEDLDLARGLIRVRRLKRPSARRTVPMPPGLADVLRGWLARRSGPHVFPNRNGNPWSGGSVGYRPGDRLRQAGLAVGVAGFSPSSLRHSFATACATTWRVQPATLQRIMGHTDLKTTMRYYVHLDDAHLIDAARSIGFAPPAPPAAA